MDPIAQADPPEVTVAFFAHVRSLLAARDPSLRFLGMTADGGRAFAGLLAVTRERTVSAEVREIGRRLGSDNRAQTIARICGASA